jgi:hypothetical protein
MNNFFQDLWREVFRVVSHNQQTSFTIAAIVVVGVGILCLRGNVIKR